MAQDAAGEYLTNSEGDPQQFSREWTAARWTFVIGLDGRIAHRDTSVSPKSDGKTIAEIICNLTAN
jgi:peroxiredoxin Q/BCP